MLATTPRSCGDEHYGESAFAFQLGEEREDLRLDR